MEIQNIRPPVIDTDKKTPVEEQKSKATGYPKTDSLQPAKKDLYDLDLSITSRPAGPKQVGTDWGCSGTQSCNSTCSGCSQTDSGCHQTQRGC